MKHLITITLLTLLMSMGVMAEEDGKELYGCEYDFNGEIFKFALQREKDEGGDYFIFIQEYTSVEFILWEEEDILILGSPILNMLKRKQVVYRTIILDKETGKFNLVATAEPRMEEKNGIWALGDGQCEKLVS